REVDERIELDDAQVLGVIDKMIKQRRESIAQFEAGGRTDLVAKETAEMQLLAAYLPAQLSAAELDAMIGEVIAATGAASIKDMGKVMAAIKARAVGRADMGAVGARIKARLSA
ncbi:MAG TPA: GatB/YqeY domain-containing protein, partial [Steroidobacteraceae bacterium]|nr:GatB/YqeY domain-containing protein [Steroidobacteraceae bacterium]